MQNAVLQPLFTNRSLSELLTFCHVFIIAFCIPNIAQYCQKVNPGSLLKSKTSPVEEQALYQAYFTLPGEDKPSKTGKTVYHNQNLVDNRIGYIFLCFMSTNVTFSTTSCGHFRHKPR
jgi:hypothetical protein